MGFAYLPLDDNLIQEASLASTDLKGGDFPARNLAVLPISRPAMTTATGSQLFTIDLPRTANVDVFAVVNHNFSDTATINLYGGNSHNPTGGTFTQGITWRKRDAFVILSSTQTYQYWTLSVDDPANLDGFLRIGYLMMGELTQPGFTFQYGWRRSRSYDGVRHRTEYGTPLVAGLFSQTTSQWNFGPLTQANADTLAGIIDDAAGDEHPLLVIPDTTVNECYFGRFGMTEVQTRNFRTYMPVSFAEDGPGRVSVTAAPFIYVAGNPDLTVADLNGVFTRSSTGTLLVNDDNLTLAIDTYAADTVRVNHFAAEFVRTLLLEDTRTNDWNYSEDFSQSDWTKIRSSISADAVSAPDGTVTADKLVEDGTASSTHYVAQVLPSLTNNTEQAVLLYAAPAERGWIALSTLDKAGTTAVSYVDLSTGVLGSIDSSHTVTIRSVANGFTEIRLVWDCSTGGTTPNVAFYIATADGVSTYSGDGSSGIYIWGAQFETDAGATASAGFGSSYIKTTTAPATRAIESLYFPYTETPKALTFYMRFIESGTVLRTNIARVATIGEDATSNVPRLLVYSQSGLDRYAARYDDNSGNNSTSGHPTDVAMGDLVELRVTLDDNGNAQIHQTLNGGSEVSATAGGDTTMASAWSSERLYVNDTGSGDRPGFNAFEAIKVARGVQTLATMRSLSPSLTPDW